MNISNFKKYILLIIILVFSLSIISYGKESISQDKINETLILLKIIEDNSQMSDPVSRAEFSKIIIKASKDKEKISDQVNEAVCNDVLITTPYASYIKKAIENGYMYTYLGGVFKPNEYVTYNDLSRACLALLDYNNDDFRGNQVIGRNMKFESLKLNTNISKKENEIITKQDIVNGIYNTLKENVKDSDSIYGLSVFNKLILVKNNELDAIDYVKNETKGPFFARYEDDIECPFELNDFNVYLNGVKSRIEEVKFDIGNYGYIVYYLDLNNNYFYAYSERHDISAPIMVRKGYIYKVYYAASDMTTPYRVDIDNYKYMIESEEMKFAFSVNGSFKEDDQIIYLCNKMNDVSRAYLDESGKVVYNNEESEPYNGSIITAFSISNIK